MGEMKGELWKPGEWKMSDGRRTNPKPQIPNPKTAPRNSKGQVMGLGDGWDGMGDGLIVSNWMGKKEREEWKKVLKSELKCKNEKPRKKVLIPC